MEADCKQAKMKLHKLTKIGDCQWRHPNTDYLVEIEFNMDAFFDQQIFQENTTTGMSCFIQIVICYEADPHLITLFYTPLSCAKRRMKVFFQRYAPSPAAPSHLLIRLARFICNCYWWRKINRCL